MTPPAGANSRGLALPFDAHEIRTDRLLLRPLTEADADDVFAYQSLEEVVRYLPWPLRNREESREHTLKRAGFTRLEEGDGGLIFAVELVGAAGDDEGDTGGRVRGPVIGDMSVFLANAAEERIEIGWVFHPAFQGRGFATEAARAVLDLAFSEIGAHRVIAQLSPENSASVALCQRLGMRAEALFVESDFFKGKWDDLAIHAILRREWEAADCSPHAPV